MYLATFGNKLAPSAALEMYSQITAHMLRLLIILVYGVTMSSGRTENTLISL